MVGTVGFVAAHIVSRGLERLRKDDIVHAEDDNLTVRALSPTQHVHHYTVSIRVGAADAQRLRHSCGPRSEGALALSDSGVSRPATGGWNCEPAGMPDTPKGQSRSGPRNPGARLNG